MRRRLAAGFAAAALLVGGAGIAAGAATPQPVACSYDGATLTCPIAPATVTKTATSTVRTTVWTTVATTSSPSTTTAGGLPAGVTLQQVDGGTGYYGKWTGNTLPTDPAFFPVGVWMEQGSNAPRLLGYGINTIVNPVAGQGVGIYNVGALEDEADMWAGPGSAAWTGNYPGQGPICNPSTASCGYTVMQSYQAGVPAGSMRYANYGKGISFWETDAQAAQFVNTYQDVVSADLYWGTDDDLCQATQGGAILGTGAALPAAQCHQASNYGRTVDRVRQLVSPAGSKPVWNYVELGHPGSNGGQMPIPEIRAAVWSSLIHQARGVVYFNHSFGGICQTQHVLDDCDPAIAATVTAINSQIQALAPALNAPTAAGYVTAAGKVDVLAKYNAGQFHVFAGSTSTTSGATTFTVATGTTATVLGENRTISIVGGKFTDTFADSNAVHLYQIN